MLADTTIMGPPLPRQIATKLVTYNASTGSFHTSVAAEDRSTDEMINVVLKLGSVHPDTHDIFYDDGRILRVEELPIEQVAKYPQATDLDRWRDLMKPSSTRMTLYAVPQDQPGATETVNAALAQSASPSEFAEYSVFSENQTDANTRLVDGFFLHDKKQLNASLACLPARFFYGGFMTAAQDLRKIKTEGLEELKARADNLFGAGKVVEDFTSEVAVELAHRLSSDHTMHYADEMSLRTSTQEFGADLLGLERLNEETALKTLFKGAKEAKVDVIRGLHCWPIVVEEWKKEDGAGHERLQAAQGFRKHLLWVEAKKKLDDAHVPAPVNVNRGVFPGLVLSHRGADVTVGYFLRSGNSFAYEVGEMMHLFKDGATNARNELRDTRVAVFFGTLAKLCREIYAFVCSPGVAPCLPNMLCGGQGEFGQESNRLQEGNPRVLKTTWTPPGAGSPLDVVVKLMTKSSYGKEAQDLAGDFAPKLHYYGHVDEGFYAAVMDFVPGGVNLSVAHESALKALRNHFKDNNIVHGDLRPQNLVFRPDGSVAVLDWDWGGARSKNPRYPVAMNTTWHWHEGAVGGGLIEHEHDCYELDKLHVEIDKMKETAAQKRKAEEDAPDADERRGTAPTSQ